MLLWTEYFENFCFGIELNGFKITNNPTLTVSKLNSALSFLASKLALDKTYNILEN